MRKRNWLVEDNLVALYLALHGVKGLQRDEREIAKIISHKGFPMRIKNYLAVASNGREGLSAGLRAPLFSSLFRIVLKWKPQDFQELVGLILDVKEKVAAAPYCNESCNEGSAYRVRRVRKIRKRPS